ncbi:hypothetical protein ACS0TY_007886 [Phlomoides rotata]
MQEEDESLAEAWERFKDLVRSCPQHGFSRDQRICYFYNGMDHRTRGMVDASAGGSLLGRTTEEGVALLEEMAKNGNQWPSERRQHRRVAATQDSDVIVSLNSKFDSLMSMMSRQQDRQARGNPPPNPNQYHPGLRHHENFSYANPRNALQPPEDFKIHKGVIEESSSSKPSMEEMFTNFMGETTKFMIETKNFMKETRQEMGDMKAHVKVIERQMSQLANIVGSQHKQGQFPSNTELNPKEQYHAIMVRSGASYDEPKMPTRMPSLASKLPSASGGWNKVSRPHDLIEEPDGLSCGCFNIFKRGGSKKFQKKERDDVVIFLKEAFGSLRKLGRKCNGMSENDVM